ncbi:MAG: c-type cytochrome [Bacteroidales bacterium]|nr:c-type cytochrome [Bacteroidales bacterium]
MKSGIFKIGSLLAAFLFVSFFGFAQDFAPWPVPDEASVVKNPVEANKTSLEAGKSLYTLQCKACHGETGRGDGLIKAASLVSENFQSQTDGAILWKLHQGRGQMPSFKALPDDQLWNVINYVRSLSKKPEDIIMKNAVVSLFFNEKAEQKELTAKVEQVNDNGEKLPAQGIKVNVGVQKYFGILPISSTSNYTSENGEINIVFPNNIIGDENGELTIIASVDDMEFNPARVSENISWGQINPKDYWSERRALWKNNDYIPLWLLISFTVGAISVWLVIMYVALLVRKIKIEGDKSGLSD